jgi:hypothetical protein
LAEIERLPFTTGNIRAVRVYADPGGSPTAVDVQVSEMQARAEQIAAGVPRRPEPPRMTWVWWVVAGVAGVVLLGWLWLLYPVGIGGKRETGPHLPSHRWGPRAWVAHSRRGHSSATRPRTSSQ